MAVVSLHDSMRFQVAGVYSSLPTTFSHKLPRLPPSSINQYTGHINHAMFWQMLCPPKDFTPPSGKIAEAVKSDFGSLDSLISTFNASTAAVQGSGWGWLAYNPAAKKLVVATTANQDPLQATTGLVPILGM